MVRWAASVSSSNTVVSSGRDELVVLPLMSMPMIATFTPLTVLMVKGWMYPVADVMASGVPSAGLTLAASTGVLQLPLRRWSRKTLRPASPSSNSWLPRAKASKHTVFISAASASPLKRV